ncbi:MAG: tetratricopeptide repeat protein [Pseudomonadota bacterium]
MTLPLLALLALLPVSSAGQDECVACCRAGGLAGCRTDLKLYGDGATASPEAGGWRIMGLWTLSCDGRARFEAGATAVVAQLPVAGELLLATTPPMAFHCFTQACSFPESACFQREAVGRVRMVDCRDGAPMSAVQLARPGPAPPGSEAVIVVVGDHPLVAEPLPGEAHRSSPVTHLDACCGGPPPPPSAAVVTQTEAGSTLPADPSTTPRDHHPYVIDVPAPPIGAACEVADALATEARRRDAAGNDAVLAGQLQRAIDEYRAALTLDPCNPWAWADLGAVALQVGMASEAAVSLAQAIELQPRHYAAYTNLGLAYEALGQDALAADAFRAALALRPHHGPAEEGLRRIEGRRDRNR